MAGLLPFVPVLQFSPVAAVAEAALVKDVPILPVKLTQVPALPVLPVLQFSLDAVTFAVALVSVVPILRFGHPAFGLARAAMASSTRAAMASSFRNPLAIAFTAAVFAASSPLLPESSAKLGLSSRVFAAGECDVECLRLSPLVGSCRGYPLYFLCPVGSGSHFSTICLDLRSLVCVPVSGL